MSTLRHLAPLAAVVLWVAVGCAPVPTPGTVSPPPQTTSRPTPRPAPAPAPAPARPKPLRLDGEPSVEVGLAWDIDTLVLRATRRTLTWRVGGPRDRAQGSSARLLVRRIGSDLELRSGESTTSPATTLRASDTLWVGEPQDGRANPEAQMFWNNKTWRGQGKVFRGPRGGITFVVRVPLEAYLTGVVPGEIGALADDLVEAGRAQAIAARSYTLYYRGRRGTEGFDLYGTVDDQVYGPVESEKPLATRCVETTRGRVGMHEGTPIRANYCSTCGGITADVWEGFPATGFPYLKSRRDSNGGTDYCARSPHHRWREQWDAGAFLETVKRYAPLQGIALPPKGIGRLIDVRVIDRSRSGRAWRLEIVTSTGTITVPAYSIRWVLRRPGGSGSILRSTLIKIDVKRDRTTRRALAVVATGAGSGHGVGLCQTGALGMAREGKTGEAILEHYYPGASLVRAYGAASR